MKKQTEKKLTEKQKLEIKRAAARAFSRWRAALKKEKLWAKRNQHRDRLVLMTKREKSQLGKKKAA